MKKTIGYISYTHGLDGKVKIVPMVSNIDFEKYIKNNNKIYIDDEKKNEIEIEIFAFTGKIFLCKIKDVNSIEKAKNFLKKEIFVEVEEDDFIDAEKLINFDVFTEKNEFYGKVIDCGDYGAGMLIEVELNKNKKSEFYLCNKENILKIYWKNKNIIIKKMF